MKNTYVYDWFNPTDESERWLGRGNVPVNPPTWIRDIALDISVKFRSVACGAWTAADYIGGIKACGNAFCVFRVFNGGRDRKGRPNRWVMLAVESPRGSGIAADVFDALECPVFKAYAERGVPERALVPVNDPLWTSLPWSEFDSIPESATFSGIEATVAAKKYSRTLTASGQDDGIVWVENIRGEVRARVESKNVRKGKSVRANEPSGQGRALGKELPASERMRMAESSRETSFLTKNKNTVPIVCTVLILVGVAVVGVLWKGGGGEPVKERNVSSGGVELPPETRQSKTFPMSTYCTEYEKYIYVPDFDTSYLDEGNRYYCPSCGGEHKWTRFHKSEGKTHDQYQFNVLKKMRESAPPLEGKDGKPPEKDDATE